MIQQQGTLNVKIKNVNKETNFPPAKALAVGIRV
jgi:hypothetical protein